MEPNVLRQSPPCAGSRLMGQLFRNRGPQITKRSDTVYLQDWDYVRMEMTLDWSRSRSPRGSIKEIRIV